MPASFKLASQSVRAIERLANAPLTIRSGSKAGLEAHALKLKREFQARRGKAAKGLRYESAVPYGEQWSVTFRLRYIAFWHEEGTRPHLILARSLGRARLDKRTGRQTVRALTKRQQASGVGARALHTPKGYRAAARVRGVRAGHYFERLVALRAAQGDQLISEAVMRRMATGR